MNTRFLFPHAAKKWGWTLIVPSVCLGSIVLFIDEFKYLDYFMAEFYDEIALTGILAGLMMVGFSKLKIEDEYTYHLRLDSLLWATYCNIALLLLATLFVYDEAYFDVMQYNLFSLPLIFVARFHIYLSRR